MAVEIFLIHCYTVFVHMLKCLTGGKKLLLPLESLFPSSEGCPDIFSSQLHSHCSLQFGYDLLVGNGLTRFILIHHLRLLIDSLEHNRTGRTCDLYRQCVNVRAKYSEMLVHIL